MLSLSLSHSIVTWDQHARLHVPRKQKRNERKANILFISCSFSITIPFSLLKVGCRGSQDSLVSAWLSCNFAVATLFIPVIASSRRPVSLSHCVSLNFIHLLSLISISSVWVCTTHYLLACIPLYPALFSFLSCSWLSAWSSSSSGSVCEPVTTWRLLLIMSHVSRRGGDRLDDVRVMTEDLQNAWIPASPHLLIHWFALLLFLSVCNLTDFPSLSVWEEKVNCELLQLMGMFLLCILVSYCRYLPEGFACLSTVSLRIQAWWKTRFQCTQLVEVSQEVKRWKQKINMHTSLQQNELHALSIFLFLWAIHDLQEVCPLSPSTWWRITPSHSDPCMLLANYSQTVIGLQKEIFCLCFS